MVKPTCIKGDCERRVSARAMCQFHYNKWRKQAGPDEVRPYSSVPAQCIVPDCESNLMKRGGRGYCSMHYQRVLSNGDPGEPGSRLKASQFDEHGRKVCPGCNEAKPPELYYSRASGRGGSSYYCRPCAAADSSQRRQRDPAGSRDRRRARYKANAEENREIARQRYRDNPIQARVSSWRYQGIEITVSEFERMMAEQSGLCLICDKPEADNGKALAVDHDHETGKVRGLLCDRCNQGLGRFKDSPELLRRALLYLGN